MFLSLKDEICVGFFLFQYGSHSKDFVDFREGLIGKQQPFIPF